MQQVFYVIRNIYLKVASWNTCVSPTTGGNVILHAYKTRGKIYFLCLIILGFGIGKQKDKSV
jgi:hypothetical protein